MKTITRPLSGGLFQQEMRQGRNHYQCPGIINTSITQGRGNISPSISDKQLERLQAYYQAKGCRLERVAEGMVRAVQQGQDLLLAGPFAKLIFHLKRLPVGLMRRIRLNDARKIG